MRCLASIVTAGALLTACTTKPAPGRDKTGSAARGRGDRDSGSGGRIATITCTRVDFATTTPVPEASGAAWLEIGGQRALVVISDSGNGGAYSIVDPESGETLEEGELPLGTADEDLEGAAIRDGKLHVITSPGWIRAYRRVERGFELADGPYPLGPIDLPPTKSVGDKPPEGTGMVCAPAATNCGRNYEGLCLAPEATTTGVVGFAASKADGHLYGLTVQEGRLAVQHAMSIRIARPGVLADCAFAEDGRLFVGSNLFDLGHVYRVEGWQEPGTAKVETIGPLAIGFPETIAARGDLIYRMSDTGGAPSMMLKFRCQ